MISRNALFVSVLLAVAVPELAKSAGFQLRFVSDPGPVAKILTG